MDLKRVDEFNAPRAETIKAARFDAPRTVAHILLTAALLVILSSGALAGTYTNQADVKVTNTSTSDGAVTFKFKPKGGAMQYIVVKIEEKWTAETVAREVQSVLDNEIGANCRVSWNNKRKVTITKRNNRKRFYLGLSEQTGHGVTFDIDYD